MCAGHRTVAGASAACRMLRAPKRSRRRSSRRQAIWLALLLIPIPGCGDTSPSPSPATRSAANDSPETAETPATAPDGAAPVDATGLEELIDRLVDVSEPGFGYSVYFAGSEFLPYEETGQMGMFVFGGTRRARSETLLRLVEAGSDAVPTLIEHLGDDRQIRTEPIRGMMWIDFPDEYDFNERTRPAAPVGVNRRDSFLKEKHPDRHALTVGDLCFVALGQIVNRHFSASRYQPSGGAVINSPTHSTALRKAIVDEWSGLTKQQHKDRLIEDFVKPDHEGRRTGAYLRLAHYYPAAVESLVLDELAKPTFDAVAVEKLCRERLYKTRNTTERRRIYDEFIRLHGEASVAGLMDQLFDDLDTLETHERGALSPPLTDFGTQPRELLIQLFQKPAGITSKSRPIVVSASATERARLIEVLIHDDSRRIGDAVREIYLKSPTDARLATACLRSLASRGSAEFLIEQLNRIVAAGRGTRSSGAEDIKAVSHSTDPLVKARLLEIIRTTNKENYFMAALPAIDSANDAIVLDSARRILTALPDEARDGQALLGMIGGRFPNEAKDIYRSFLAKGSAARASTMCNVLWYDHPLAREVLSPLLDDKRPLDGSDGTIRVCDRAGQAISHTLPKDFRSKYVIEFEGSIEKRDRDMARVKQFLKENP